MKIALCFLMAEINIINIQLNNKFLLDKKTENPFATTHTFDCRVNKFITHKIR